MSGVLIVLAIMIVAGVVAYIGDRVGHQVGRKRLTLFGLRPKYTSTIVAVATGMLIALVVTLAALIGSNYVRTAFFRINQLNGQINSLQAQALSQQKELKTTREGALVLPRRTPVAPYFRLLDLTRPESEQLRDISTFFDETVAYANRTLTQPPIDLRPIQKKSSDAATRVLLERQLQAIRVSEAAAQGSGPPLPVVLLPVAAQNLFRGDTITMAFDQYVDKRVASAGTVLGAVQVSGGAPPSNVEIGLLYNHVLDALAAAGYPAPFLFSPVSGFDQARLQAVSLDLARARGRYRLVAKATGDIYPHMDRFTLTTALEPAR